MINNIESILNKGDVLSNLDHIWLPSQGGDRVGLRLGFGIDLYISDPDRQRIRSGVVEVVSDYQKHFPEMLNRFLPDEARKLRKITGNLAQTVANDMARVSLQDGYGMLLLGEHSSTQRNDDVARYALGTLIQRTSDTRNSFLEGYIPLGEQSHVDGQGYTDYISTVLRWCEFCRPIHGSAGISVFLKFDSQHQTSELAFPLLKRFPGLNFVDAGTFVLEASTQVEKIKCINWLTILDNKLLNALGGLEKMRAAIEPICKVHRFSSGVVIQAGELPQLGDANMQQVPNAYRLVAAYTKTLRFAQYKSGLFKVPPSLDSREEALLWANRFD